MLFLFLLLCIATKGFAYGIQEQEVTINNFPLQYKKYAYSKCKENDLSYEMFLAVAFNESRFTVNATNINKNGTIDRGLCQINDSCFSFLNSKGVLKNKEQLFDPYININCYIELMKYHKEFTGDEDLALLRYQVGAGGYKKVMSNGGTNKTHQRVLKYKKDFKEYLINNPHEILDLYSLSNFPYLCEDFPEFNSALNARFTSFEWEGRYR